MNNVEMESTIIQVPIEDIIPNRFQPRLAFDDDALQDLATSIKQHGIIQPLVLRRNADKYEIIAGERRYKAARMAGLLAVPAIISKMDDNTSAEVAIVENVQRKNLTAIEEAKSYQALLEKGYLTQEELAKKMGLSQSSIANKIRLLSLDESVQEAVIQEKISERHARTLLQIPDKEMQKVMLNKIINERLTVKQLDEEIKRMNGNKMIGNREEVPVIQNPNINNIVNNSTDINNPTLIESNDKIDLVPKTQPVDVFSSPEKMPNTFFNYLENQAVNMDIVEPIVNTFEAPKEETKPVDINNTEGIEMLDEFSIPQNSAIDSKDDTFNEILSMIRNMNLDSSKVKVEEINYPQEYRINITIKKDTNN